MCGPYPAHYPLKFSDEWTGLVFLLRLRSGVFRQPRRAWELATLPPGDQKGAIFWAVLRTVSGAMLLYGWYLSRRAAKQTGTG
jgi:hypothetical protein